MAANFQQKKASRYILLPAGWMITFLFASTAALYDDIVSADELPQRELPAKAENGQPEEESSDQPEDVAGNRPDAGNQPDAVNKPKPVLRQQLPPLEDGVRLQERKERLDRHMAVFRDWLKKICSLSNDQEQSLSVICEAEVRISQISWKNDPNFRQSTRLTDYEPVEFTNIAGAAECLLRARFCSQLKELLTAEQLDQLEKATAKRDVSHDTADCRYMASQFDEVLELTNEQFDVLEQRFRTLLPYASSRLVSARPGTEPLRYQALAPVMARVSELTLTYEQRRRTSELTAAVEANQNLLRFRCSTEEGRLETELQKIMTLQRSEMIRISDETVAQLEKEWNLNPAQVTYLRLAGRGAGIKYLEQWKAANLVRLNELAATRKKMQEVIVVQQERLQRLTIEAAQARGLNPAIAIRPAAVVELNCELTGINRQDMFHHPIWLQAVRAVRPEEDAPKIIDSQRRLQSIAMFIVVTLDRELWLTEQQRDDLLELVRRTTPSSNEQISAEGRELVWLAIPLARISRSEVARILNEPQLQVWDLLIQRYQLRDNQIKLRTLTDTQLTWSLPD